MLVLVPRAGLEHVDREMPVVLPAGHLARPRRRSRRDVGLEQPSCALARAAACLIERRAPR